MKNKFYLKSMATIFGLNFIIYFGIKLFISNYNYIGISLDNKIPFIPEFIYFYSIWYPFLFLTFFYIYKKDKDNYINLITTTSLSLLILYVFFIAYPTKMIRPNINNINSISLFITNIVYKTDYPTNCFPSGHCLLCFILLFITIKSKKLNSYFKVPIIIIDLLIIMSTVLVKQHVIVDIFGSLALSLFAYLLVTKTNIFKDIINKLKTQINK